MTQAEKLEALANKATENGFNDIHGGYKVTASYNQAGSVSLKYWAATGAMFRSDQFSIFDHNFARALFGEELIEIDKMLTEMGNKFPVKQSACCYHLQQAVISDDSIDYMYKAVFEGVPTINGVPLNTPQGKAEEKRIEVFRNE